MHYNLLYGPRSQFNIAINKLINNRLVKYELDLATPPNAFDKKKCNMHQPGIEPGSVPWQGTILPLDHWCLVWHYNFLFLKMQEEAAIFGDLKTYLSIMLEDLYQ